MPGVVISTAVRTGPSATTVRESSQLFVVGLAERGPIDEAVLIQSLADFELNFGEFISSSYVHPTVETFFEEGGTQCYVARVVGASATTGTLDLDDASANTVLTIDASGPGSWSSNVDVVVEEVSASVSCRVKIYYNDNLIYNTGTVTSASQAAGRINTSPVASKYVTATAASGATTLPAALAATPLTAGDSNHSGITDQDHIDAMELFLDSLGTGAVCAPDVENTSGNTDYTVSEALVAHANAYSRIAILHGAIDDSSSDVIDKASSIQGGDNAEHAAIYYPWVDVPTSITGVTRRIPPDGYVAAKRALAHNQTGPHIAPAGLISSALFVTGLAADINKTSGDALDDAGVNAIRVIQNSVRVYGARSLSSDDDNFRYITTQDIVNTVVVDSQRTLEDLVFSPIDGRETIYANIAARLTAVLVPLRNAGALFPSYDSNGRLIDPGFTVRCDSALNPISQLAGGTVKAKVGVRTSSVGDKIEVEIVKSNLTASVVQ